MVKSEGRLDFIDVAKCLGMIGVIWGHIMTTGATFVLAYAFDIPLFFFLAGMVYSKSKYTTIKLLLKNKIRTLLIPYVIFSVATWVVWCGYNLVSHNNVNYIEPLLQTVIAQVRAAL